jgi:tRNA C32,U32 (ribose-2'-O)-methylase TrmJ
LVSYEVFRHGAAGVEPEPIEAAESAVVETSEERRPATAAELQNLFEHLERELDLAHFFRVEAKRTPTLHSLRNALQRGGLRRHEVRMLHGVIAALTGRRKDGSPTRRSGSKGRAPTSR